MNLVTVITPTFNRAVTLSRCWQSLKKQSNKNFQWLIIDDGSTDETLDLVNGLKKETKDFQIDYYWKINGGKHTALNFSHQYIKGDFVLILDSDDCLTVDAIDTILNEWKQNRNNSNIAGVTFMCGMKKDVPLAKMSQNRVLSNHIDFRINKKIVGDCCETLRTKVFKSYLFPEIKGEFFLGEGMLWTSVALKYETLYINKVIYIVPEYRPDGLTQAGRKMRLKNLQGALLNCELHMNTRIKWSFRFKNAILKTCYSFFLHKTLREILMNTEFDSLIILASPIGYLLFLYWSRKYEV